MNGWLESGRSNTFVGVRPDDVVFRSSLARNALILGNGLNSGANAAMYVTSNCIGIHRLPNPAATIALDIGGEVACRSNMVWCDPSATAANVMSGSNATKVSASGLVLNDGTQDTVSIDRAGLIKTSGRVQAMTATFGDSVSTDHKQETVTVRGRAGFDKGVCLLIEGDPLASAAASLSFNKTNGVLSVGTHATLSSNGLTITGSIASSAHMFAPAYKVLSDQRMKTDVEDSDPVRDLSDILALGVKRYVLVDNGSERDVGRQVGVLAQELALVVPEAVSRVSDYLPDVMQHGEREDEAGNTEHGSVWLRFPTSLAVSHVMVGDMLRMKVGDLVASAVVSGQDYGSGRIRITGVAQGALALAASPPKTGVFVYGRLRNDIMAVDTSQILFRLVSAVQGLHARIEELSAHRLGQE